MTRVMSSMVVPLLAVLDMIVWIALILVSYSEKPAFIGSIVRAETILFPALIAELVIFARAVTAMTSRAENFIRTDSTAPLSPDILS